MNHKIYIPPHCKVVYNILENRDVVYDMNTRLPIAWIHFGLHELRSIYTDTVIPSFSLKYADPLKQKLWC